MYYIYCFFLIISMTLRLFRIWICAAIYSSVAQLASLLKLEERSWHLYRTLTWWIITRTGKCMYECVGRKTERDGARSGLLLECKGGSKREKVIERRLWKKLNREENRRKQRNEERRNRRQFQRRIFLDSTWYEPNGSEMFWQMNYELPTKV